MDSYIDIILNIINSNCNEKVIKDDCYAYIYCYFYVFTQLNKSLKH